MYDNHKWCIFTKGSIKLLCLLLTIRILHNRTKVFLDFSFYQAFGLLFSSLTT